VTDEPMVKGWPAWLVMLAEVVVGMHDGRVAEGRRPSRNVAATVASCPPGLIAVAREQNATRAARDERPVSGPRMAGSVPVLREPAGYPGGTRRSRLAD
jgi:hypothetical protein